MIKGLYIRLVQNWCMCHINIKNNYMQVSHHHLAQIDENMKIWGRKKLLQQQQKQIAKERK